jgi:hypothetical protein
LLPSGKSLAQSSNNESSNISSVPSGRTASSRPVFKLPAYYRPLISQEQVEAETNTEIGKQFGARPKTKKRIAKSSTELPVPPTSVNVLESSS